MKSEIKKILEAHKKDKIIISKAVNDILLLFIVKKDEVEICPICDECVLINNVCTKCTVDLCSPLEG